MPVSVPTSRVCAGRRMSSPTRYRIALAANVVAIGLVLAYVASLAVPASEATRLRNAMLIDRVTAAETAWTPDRPPAAFMRETAPPSALFADVVRRLGVPGIESDWDKALVLADHLTRNAKDLGPIQSDLDTTYRAIVDEGRGYCADFTQVYLGLAHAAGLFAREWAFSLDGFGGHGHAVIEIFDRQRGRWLWLDVYNNVHAVDAVTQEPLSSAEFRAYTIGARPSTIVRRNGPGRLGYVHTHKLVDYYRRGASEWYLWGGNAVFTYEAHPLVRAGSVVAAPVAQLSAIAAGVHPRIFVVPDAGNAAQLARMDSLRSTLAAIAVLLLLLFSAVAGLMLKLYRLRAGGGDDATLDAGASAMVHRAR